MTGKLLQPWIVIRNYMDDEERGQFVETALDCLISAPPDLRMYALDQLSRGLDMPMRRVANGLLDPNMKIAAEHEVRRVTGVAATMICLWAEARAKFLSDFLSNAAKAGFVFSPEWHWEDARRGCHEPRTIPLFEEWRGKYYEITQTFPEYEYKLAFLWFSRALLKEPETLSPIELVVPPSPMPIEETLTAEDVIVDALRSLIKRPTYQESPTQPVATIVEATPPVPVPPTIEPASANEDLPLPEESAPQETPPAPPPSVEPVALPAPSLSEQYQSLQQYYDTLRQSQARVIMQVKQLLGSLESMQIQEAIGNYQPVERLIAAWQEALELFADSLHRTLALVNGELAMRSDIGLPPFQEESPTSIDAISAALEKISKYDESKADVLNTLHDSLSRSAQLRKAISVWFDEELDQPELANPLADNDSNELTLTQARNALKIAQSNQQKLEERQQQLREISIGRIKQTLPRLAEVGWPIDAQIADEYTLSQLEKWDLPALENQKLRKIEKEVASCFNEQILKMQAAHKNETAQHLLSYWKDETLAELIAYLGRNNREAELVLLLLASNHVHPRAAKLALDSDLARNILIGVEQLSPDQTYWELLNTLGPTLFRGLHIENQQLRAELCLIFLAATYHGPFILPDDFLWELAEEWPLQGMDNWKKLWEASLYGTPISIYTPKYEGDKQLNEARNKAEERLIRIDGAYLRAASARKSTRHMGLLNNQLLPQFSFYLEKLHACDAFIIKGESVDLETCIKVCEALTPSDEWNALKKKLGRNEKIWKTVTAEKIKRYLSEELVSILESKELTEWYEREAVSLGIKDPDPFHRRNVIGVLEDCAESLLTYANAQLEFWLAEQARETNVLSNDLQHELEQFANLTALGRSASEYILQGVQARQPWDQEHARQAFYLHLEEKLLSEASFVMRLPRLVGKLTETAFENWQQVLQNLLEDLAEPLNKVQAANHLLQVNAPNQTLLLTEFIPLELQKQAQKAMRDQERAVADMQSDLLTLGVELPDLKHDVDLGRWSLLRQTLTAHLTTAKALSDQARTRAQEWAKSILVQISTIGITLIDHMDNIPHEAYDLLQEGLNIARMAASKSVALAAIEDYIKEIRYRLDHASWATTEIQQANLQLQQAYYGNEVDHVHKMDMETTIKHLEQGNLKALGLREDQLPNSTINTRVEVLTRWTQLRTYPSILSENLAIVQQENIQSFFSFFAEMVSMKRVRTSEGKVMEYTQPVCRSYWALQFPRSHALTGSCILIAIPGSATIREIEEFETFLLSQELMTAFVLVFVPGVNGKIINRLREFRDPRFSEKRLVVIDESSILSMAMAEAAGLIPLDRLRPMIFNAHRSHIAVFKYNAEVDSHFEIFVGRKSEIERLASGGENFAIYGGRRIGKSSLLKAIQNRLVRRNVHVVFHSFEGEDCAEDPTARKLATLLSLELPVETIDDLKMALQHHFSSNPDSRVVLLLDEIDKYIEANTKRHQLIEIFRTVSNQSSGRFQLIIAGFMGLHRCLKGHGPYSPTSDPWARMLNDLGPLGNLKSQEAEEIIKEGFIGILGWSFENRAIPQKIIQMTGGHPAFVQKFCADVQDKVTRRGDRTVFFADIKSVFDDLDPNNSFIAYVRKTLDMNLTDPVSKYLIVWIATYYSESQSFTLGQLRELANQSPVQIPQANLDDSLTKLMVTSVVRERSPQVYEFSVKDYPAILAKMGEAANLEKIEEDLRTYLNEQKAENNG